MPWKASSVVDERTRFVLEHERGLYTMTDLCEIYDIAGDWLLLAAAVPARRAGGAARPRPGARASSESDAGADRRGRAPAAASAHELGPAKTETRIGAGNSAEPVAGGEHHGCHAGAGRVGGSAQETASRTALHATVCLGRCAQPSLVRGLQRLV